VYGATGFKTGLEEGLICNVCVGTHPGLFIYVFNVARFSPVI